MKKKKKIKWHLKINKNTFVGVLFSSLLFSSLLSSPLLFSPFLFV